MSVTYSSHMILVQADEVETSLAPFEIARILSLLRELFSAKLTRSCAWRQAFFLNNMAISSCALSELSPRGLEGVRDYIQQRQRGLNLTFVLPGICCKAICGQERPAACLADTQVRLLLCSLLLSLKKQRELWKLKTQRMKHCETTDC
jgi:hypothetical protein